MTEYFCHQCAISCSLVTPASPVNLTGSQYQLDKFIKHTAPAAAYQLNSVFDDPTYKSYGDYVVSTAASGALQIDDHGRKNLVWFAGRRTGAEYCSGVFAAPTEGVKVVLPENDTKLHAYPIAASPHSCAICPSCGTTIPLW